MSVVGFRPPDEQWERMKKVYDSCQEAGIDVPNEVSSFFNDKAPDPVGVEVEIKNAASEWQPEDDDSTEGYEVNITKLPKGVAIIRFKVHH